MVKIFQFDTNAVIKYFHREKGSDVVKWIVNNRINNSISISISKNVKKELPNVLKKLAKRGNISYRKARIIYNQAISFYFKAIFIIRDDKARPGFRTGSDTEYDELIERHKLCKGKNDWDVHNLMCINNYLRCFNVPGVIHMVTSDKKLRNKAKRDGISVIDPEKMSISQLQFFLREADSH